jgi:hypothetical protein
MTRGASGIEAIMIPHKSNAMFALRGLARSRRQGSLIGSFLVMTRLDVEMA